MSRNPYAYPPEHRRYDPGDPHGRKLDGDFRKRLDRALDRQLALENQVRAVLADYPISDQVQGLLDLLVGMARSGRGYDLETLIAILQEFRKMTRPQVSRRQHRDGTSTRLHAYAP